MTRSALIALALALFFGPATAQADYVDVIGGKLNEGCSLEKYLKLVDEFRGVMKENNYEYTVEILQPVTSEDLSIIWWIGRSKDFPTFAEGYTQWEKALSDSKSAEAKLNKKIVKCSTNVSRAGMLSRGD